MGTFEVRVAEVACAQDMRLILAFLLSMGLARGDLQNEDESLTNEWPSYLVRRSDPSEDQFGSSWDSAMSMDTEYPYEDWSGNGYGWDSMYRMRRGPEKRL